MKVSWLLEVFWISPGSCLDGTSAHSSSCANRNPSETQRAETDLSDGAELLNTVEMCQIWNVNCSPSISFLEVAPGQLTSTLSHTGSEH